MKRKSEDISNATPPANALGMMQASYCRVKTIVQSYVPEVKADNEVVRSFEPKSASSSDLEELCRKAVDRRAPISDVIDRSQLKLNIQAGSSILKIPFDANNHNIRLGD